MQPELCALPMMSSCTQQMSVTPGVQSLVPSHRNPPVMQLAPQAKLAPKLQQIGIAPPTAHVVVSQCTTPEPPLGEHVTITLVTSAPDTVPLLFAMLHVYSLGCADTVTEYAPPSAIAIANWNGPSAVRGRSSAPLF